MGRGRADGKTPDERRAELVERRDRLDERIMGAIDGDSSLDCQRWCACRKDLDAQIDRHDAKWSGDSSGGTVAIVWADSD
ncbi:MAG: hypothetical protein GY851_09400 [bacterium]|nr:hypothetical protein [bacterium]